MIATRMSALEFTSSHVADMISIISCDSALRASGRFSVIVTTWARRSTIACGCSLILLLRSSRALRRRQFVQPLDRRQVFLDQLVHHFLDRAGLVHAPDDLPDRIEPQRGSFL